ncbi:bpX6 domain-containing protein [Pseudomonas batumici]|uniref:bpX6 domain-containing protein n=1 Tax=Pseudomonas batumici TaxID=226910 RepID=UPI0030CF3DE1
MGDILELSVKRPGLVGWQSVGALWFPRDWFDEVTSQVEIVRHWRPGARAYRFADGDVLCFKVAESMPCDRLKPWPLIRQGQAWSSALLESDEISALPLADLWLIRGARVQALNLADGIELQPGQWFDIERYGLLETYDCREALPEPVLQAWESQDIRQVLGEVIPAPSAEREAVAKAFKTAGTATRQAPVAAVKVPKVVRASEGLKVSVRTWLLSGLVMLAMLISYWQDAARPASLSTPRSPLLSESSAGAGFNPSLFLGCVLFVALVVWLVRLSTRRLRQGTRAQTRQGAVAAAASVPERKRRGQVRPSLWRQWLERMAVASQFNRLLERRQAAYMKRMLEMFESGNIAEALHYAIPLGSDQAWSGRAFGTPKRRDQLTVGKARGPAASLELADGLREHLRRTYRQTFERLDRQGRIEEAVYVLAELLHVRQEALDYLEKHQRYPQAAELALTWDLRPAMIVRLLCLADDWQRAVQVARRDRAFANAVLSLQDRWPEAAERLRIEWAEMLVGQGDWLEAVEVIWPLPKSRERARQWLLSAEAAGGGLAAAALAKRAVLLPDTLEVHEPYLRALRDDPQRGSERADLARELLKVSPAAGKVRSMAAAIVHGVLADHAGGHPGLTPKELAALVKLSGDELLRLDMPSGVIAQQGVSDLATVIIPTPHWSAPPPGSYSLYDAVPLNDEGYLVALGESGAAMVDRSGSLCQRFAVPAQRLVISKNRRVALALVRRDELWRVSKLDLVTGSATDLGVLAMDFFASTFEGVAWTIATRKQVRVVDIDKELATLWHVSDLPGPLVHFDATDIREHWLLQLADGTFERWNYSLPERRLLSRGAAPKPIRGDISWQFYSFGEYLECWFEAPAEDQQELVVNDEQRLRRFRFPEITEDLQPQILSDRQWLVVGFRVSLQRMRWHFMNRSSSQLCAILDWGQGQDVAVRRHGADWIFTDSDGRLFHVNVITSRVRNLSIH